MFSLVDAGQLFDHSQTDQQLLHHHRMSLWLLYQSGLNTFITCWQLKEAEKFSQGRNVPTGGSEMSALLILKPYYVGK